MIGPGPGPTVPHRCKNALDRWMLAVEMQQARVNAASRGQRPHVEGTLLFVTPLEELGESSVVDTDLYIIALNRLARAARLTRTQVLRDWPGPPLEVEHARIVMKAAIQAFDAAVPDLTLARDVGEHSDEYLMGTGRHRKDEEGFATVYRIGDTINGRAVDTGGFSWEGRGVHLRTATAAARTLYRELSAILRPLL